MRGDMGSGECGEPVGHGWVQQRNDGPAAVAGECGEHVRAWQVVRVAVDAGGTGVGERRVGEQRGITAWVIG